MFIVKCKCGENISFLHSDVSAIYYQCGKSASLFKTKEEAEKAIKSIIHLECECEIIAV
ncbi:hypothetical protein RJI07_01020 [Mycoplasmatota bacterium WC30]